MPVPVGFDDDDNDEGIRHECDGLQIKTPAALSIDDVMNDQVIVKPAKIIVTTSIINPPIAALAPPRRRRNADRSSASSNLLDLLLGRIAPTKATGRQRRQFRATSRAAERVCDDAIIGRWDGALDATIADLIIAQGADIEFTDADLNFPLAVALHYHHADQLLATLLRAGADVTRRYRDGSLLDLALRIHAPPSYVLLLLTKRVAPVRRPTPAPILSEDRLSVLAGVNSFGALAQSVLEEAWWEAFDDGDVARCKLMIEHGLERGVLFTSNRMAVHEAVDRGVSVAMLDYLLVTMRFDPNRIDRDGRHPLQIAILRHDPQRVIRLLLRSSANVHCVVSDVCKKGIESSISLVEFANRNGRCQASIDAIEAAAAVQSPLNNTGRTVTTQRSPPIPIADRE